MMGYRSDVAYSIRWDSDDVQKHRDSFYTFLAEAKANPATSPCFTMEDFSVTVNEEKFRIDFHVGDVKWYESYTEVIAHTELLKMVMEYHNDTPPHPVEYKFVRVGEQLDDVDEQSTANYDWDTPYIVRHIETD